MPASARKQYFALRALNVELASIKDGNERRRMGMGGQEAGSSLALRMRMQWWRDALNELYPDDQTSESAPSPEGFLSSTAANYWRNPVVRALHHAIEESDLTKRFLERLLDARDADLDIQQMATLDDSAAYAEDTCGSLLYLALECAGVREDAADEAASQVGIGWGLVTALRSTAHRGVGGEMAIPADLLSQPISSDYLMARFNPDFKPNPEKEAVLKEAVQFMAYTASNHLAKASELQPGVPKAGRPCLLAAIPARHYLMKLRDADHDLYNPKVLGGAEDPSRLILLAMLARSWWSGTY